MTVPSAIAASSQMVVAQAEQGGSDVQGEETEDGTGQSDAEAETGTEEADSEAAEPEAGPPWTFQMARIIIVLSVLLCLAIARWYWKLVGSRQRTS
jgi:hypothetical protein